MSFYFYLYTRKSENECSYYFLNVEPASVCSLSSAAPGLRCGLGSSLVAERPGRAPVRRPGSRSGGFSYAEHGPQSASASVCRSRAWLLQGAWDLPGLVVKALSPARAGGSFYRWTTREVLRGIF